MKVYKPHGVDSNDNLLKKTFNIVTSKIKSMISSLKTNKKCYPTQPISNNTNNINMQNSNSVDFEKELRDIKKSIEEIKKDIQNMNRYMKYKRGRDFESLDNCKWCQDKENCSNINCLDNSTSLKKSSSCPECIEQDYKWTGHKSSENKKVKVV